MLRDYFGEWTTGRLDRKRFAILYIVWLALILILGLSLMNGLIVPLEEGGSIRDAINAGNPVLTGLLSIVSIGFYLALFNIAGKRARDIGLPGWIGVVGMVILFAVSFATLRYSAGIVVTVAAILLALIPTGQFSKDAPAA